MHLYFTQELIKKNSGKVRLGNPLGPILLASRKYWKTAILAFIKHFGPYLP